MMQTIPLAGGAINAHQQFTAQLGDNFLTFHLDYQQTGQWAMDIHREGVPLVLGAMLEPNADVIAHWRLDIGKLVFTGEPTTLDNLGVSNSLVWVPPDA